TPCSSALAFAREPSISVQPTTSRISNAAQPLKYWLAMLPQPMIPTLVFSTSKPLSDEICITLCNRCHHVCGAAVKFDDVPFGAGVRQNVFPVHHPLANGHHIGFKVICRAVLDVNDRYARVK